MLPCGVLLVSATAAAAYFDKRSCKLSQKSSWPTDSCVWTPCSLQVEQVFPCRCTRLVVACRAGTRSAPACAQLAEAGYHHLLNMSAGFDGWVAAGLPVETGPLQRSSRAASTGGLRLGGCGGDEAGMQEAA